MSSYKDQGARSSLAAGGCRLCPLVGELAVRTRPTPGCFALSAPAPSRSSAAGETLCESRRYGAPSRSREALRSARALHCEQRAAEARCRPPPMAGPRQCSSGRGDRSSPRAQAWPGSGVGGGSGIGRAPGAQSLGASGRSGNRSGALLTLGV